MKKPNILLLFTDQQRYDTIEALGNPVIKTPGFNKLTENGIAFTRAYSPCPVCIPARYAMMTGQLPHKTRCTANERMPEGRRSFVELLLEAGYQTHGIGKMHFTFKDEGDMALWGFASRETSEEVNGAKRDDYRTFLKENGYGHVHDPHGVRSEMYYIPQPSQLPEKLHNTTWVTDRSIEFLRNRDENRPFFLMTSYIKPHPPFESPTPWNKLYRGPEMPLPKRPQDSNNLISYWNKFQNRYKGRDQGMDDNLVRVMKAAYYSAISFIDYNVNRLLNYMEQQGILDNTMILLTSDHGEMLGDYNCFGKRCFLDSAARIPMLLYYPGVKKGSKCNRPVSLVDVFPTFLQYAGIECNEDCSGDSLIDIAGEKSGRKITFGQYNDGEYGTYMAVTEDFKYIYSAPDQKEWLFDLKTDPEETRNRAYNTMYAGVTEEYRNQLLDRLGRDGCTEPIEGDAWKWCPKKEMPEDPDTDILFQDPASSLPNLPGYERPRAGKLKKTRGVKF